LSVYTINEQGEPDFFDRTQQKNLNRDLLKNITLKDFVVYWNSEEEEAFLISDNDCKDSYRKIYLRDYIMRGDKKNPEAHPLFDFSFDSRLTIKTVDTSVNEIEPKYKLDISLEPIKIILNNHQLRQIIEFSKELKAKAQKSKVHLTEELSEEELLAEKKAYTNSLVKFYENYCTSKPRFKWEEVLQAHKGDRDSQMIYRALVIIPSMGIIEATREAVLEINKLKKISTQKKGKSKKGLFGFWQAEETQVQPEDTQKEEEKFEEFYQSFMLASKKMTKDKSVTGFGLTISAKLKEAGVVFFPDTRSQHFCLEMRNIKLDFDFIDHKNLENFKSNIAVFDLEFFYTTKNHQMANHFIKRLNDYDHRNIITLNLNKKFQDHHRFIELNLEGCNFEISVIPQISELIKAIAPPKDDEIEISFTKGHSDKIFDSPLLTRAPSLKKPNIQTVLTFTSNLLQAAVTVPMNPASLLETDGWALFFDKIGLSTQSDLSGVSDTWNIDSEGIRMDYFDSLETYLRNREKLYLPVDQTKSLYNLISNFQLKSNITIAKSNEESESTKNLNCYLEAGKALFYINPLLAFKLSQLPACFEFLKSLHRERPQNKPATGTVLTVKHNGIHLVRYIII